MERVQGDMGMEDFDEATLEELYSWIDSIPLSRPKKNIARDFSDGVLIAEMVDYCVPMKGLVDKHNYSSVNRTDKKEANWRLMNRKVFKKFGFEVMDDVIRDIVNAKPGCIEKFLIFLRRKLDRAQWEYKKMASPKSKGGGGKRESDQPESDQHMGSPRGKGVNKAETSRGYLFRDPELEQINLITLQRPNQPGIPKRKIITSIAESDTVPRILYEEKEQEVMAKDETIQILQAKINRMEHLIHLKDVRIDDLNNRLESLRPTGVRR